MMWNRKKLWPAAAAALVVLTSFLNAADDTQMRNLENRVSALEQRKGSSGMINPPARPVVKDGVDLFLQGDVILWQASESGLGYAVTNNNSTTYVNGGSIRNPHFQWDWGFKVGAGYNIPHDGWDLFLDWTRFYASSSDTHTSAPSGGAVFPSLVNTAVLREGVPGPISAGFASASARWRLHMNLLDLEMGREFYVSKWLTLRPHAGLRSAWLRQRYNVGYYNGPVLQAGTNVLGQNLYVHMRNNFWGMGLRGGLCANWGLGSGFSLFSDFASALLLGHFRIYQLETDTSTSPIQTRLNVSSKYRATRATVDMAMGLRYEHTFANDSFGLMVQLGWEQHLFFSQNQLSRFFGTNLTGVHNYSGVFATNQGDLNTQGVTLSIKFDF